MNQPQIQIPLDLPNGIEGIIDRHIQRQVDWATVPDLELIGIDEIALKKGHKDFIVIVSGLTGQGQKFILAVLPDRKKETVKTFLKGVAASAL